MGKLIMKTKMTLAILAVLCIASHAQAACEVTKGGAKSPFDGKLSGLEVEKKSLPALNKEFPQLKVMEQMFSGALKTCTDCTDNYVKCS